PRSAIQPNNPPDSRFPIPDFRLPISDFRLPISDSRRRTPKVFPQGPDRFDRVAHQGAAPHHDIRLASHTHLQRALLALDSDRILAEIHEGTEAPAVPRCTAGGAHPPHPAKPNSVALV